MDNGKRVVLSWSEQLSVPVALTCSLIRTLYSVLKASVQPNRKKSLYRLFTDTMTRYMTEALSVRQICAVTGNSWDNYVNWVKQNRFQPEIDQLESCRLFWIGKKKTTGPVILYCHGGAFLTPLLPPMCQYWHLIQQDYEKAYKEEIGIVALEYSLTPAAFPTQLSQMAEAVKHVLKAGIQPSQLYLAGDSAGANLVLQLVSHILHPLPSVAPTTPMSPLAGMILLSPWTSFAGDTASHRSNAGQDVCSSKILSRWGNAYLEQIAESQRIYAHAGVAPHGWFSGMTKVAEKIFISAGASEVLRDDIALLGDVLSKVHPAVTFELEENGVHNESIYGIVVGSSKSRVRRMLVDWISGSRTDANTGVHK